MAILQESADIITDWSRHNDMRINATTTTEMIICFCRNDNHVASIPRIVIDNNDIERVTQYKVLGVTLSSDLSWNAYVDMVVSKVRKPVFTIYQLKRAGIRQCDLECTCKIPQDLSKSIFIALPKKPGTLECELHRTISLMSHITKVILRVIMMKPEISQEQCGFVKRDIHCRTLCERAIEVQHELYLCFIDYAKAFDNVKHEDLFEFLQNLDI